jgi:hypothetical protein
MVIALSKKYHSIELLSEKYLSIAIWSILKKTLLNKNDFGKTRLGVPFLLFFSNRTRLCGRLFFYHIFKK